MDEAGFEKMFFPTLTDLYGNGLDLSILVFGLSSSDELRMGRWVFGANPENTGRNNECGVKS